MCGPVVWMLALTGLSADAKPQPMIYEHYLKEGIRLQQEARYAEAGVAYTTALEQAEKQLGTEHAAVAQILVNLGTVRELMHDDAGALTAFKQSLAITERVFGPEDLQVAFTLQTIAMLTHKAGHYAAAEPFYRRALSTLENKLGPMHARTAFLEASMAKLFLAQRRNTEAEVLLEKAIPALESASGPDRSILATAFSDLGKAYRRDGRYATAEARYARMLAIVSERPEVVNAEIRAGLRDYAQMLRKMKRRQEAAQIDRRLRSLLPK